MPDNPSARLSPFILSVLALLAVGCSSPSTIDDAPDPATYRIHPTGLWSGATLKVESRAFRGLATLPVLRFGQVDLNATRLDDTTLAYVTPSSAGGVYDPILMLGDTPPLLSQVNVWGFASSRRYGPDHVWLPWDAYVWPHGSAQVLAGTNPGGLVLIDLDEQVVREFPGLLDADVLRGPGATPNDSVFLLRQAGEPLGAWRLSSSWSEVETYPQFPDTRQILQLGEDSWLATTGSSVQVMTRTDPDAAYQITRYDVDTPQGLHLSPRKDRATLRFNQQRGSALNGVPVFAAPGGALAYVAAINSAQGIDWNADGSQLAIAGRAAGIDAQGLGVPGKVLLLNATSGEVLGSDSFDREAFGVAFDPRRPYLYVGVTGAGMRPALRVYQRPSMTLVAELEVPAGEPMCGLNAQTSCFGGVVAVGRDAAYVLYGWNGLTRATRFFLPPP